MWHRAIYPDPMNENDVDKCGRGGKKSFVCDPDCVLTVDQADYLDHVIRRITEGTECPCSNMYCTPENPGGYRIGVAIVYKMEKDENMLDLPSETSLDMGRLFAYTLEQRWEWGKCSEDIVIFYSQGDNVVYTITGTETVKKLKPSMVGEINMKWRAFFGPGVHVYKGLEGIIKDYRDVLMGNYTSGLKRMEPPRTAAVIGDSSAPRSLFSIATLIISFVTTVLALS